MTDTRPHLVLDLDSIRENNTPYGDLGTGFHLNETERAAAIAWYESLAWGGGESITSGVEGSLGGTPIGGRITMGTNQSLWLSDIEGVESWDENIQMVFFSNDHLETIYDVIISLPVNQVMTYSGILRITTNAAREDTENYGFDLILDDDPVRTGVQRKPNANWQKLDEDVLPTLSTKAEVNASQAAQDALIDASWKQVNLEPATSARADNNAILVFNDAVTSAENMADGWIHVEMDAASLYGNVLTVRSNDETEYVDKGDYTILLEYRNAVFSNDPRLGGECLFISAPSTVMRNAQFKGHSTEPVPLGEGETGDTVRCVAEARGNNSSEMLTKVSSNGGLLSFDIRISIYEGDYDGPYIPYHDSPDDIKTRVASLESSQETQDAKAELEHVKLMVASQADEVHYMYDLVHQTTQMEFPDVYYSFRRSGNWKKYDPKDIVAIAKCYIDTSGTSLFNNTNLFLDSIVRSDPFANCESAFAECDSILKSAGITGSVIGLQGHSNGDLLPIYVTDNPAYFTEILRTSGTGIAKNTTRVYDANWQQLDVYKLQDNTAIPVVQPINVPRSYLAYERMTTYLLPSGTQEPLTSEPESFAYRVDGVNKIAYDASGNVVCRYVGEMALTDVSVNGKYLEFKHDRGLSINESGESEIWPVNATDFFDAFFYHIGKNGNLQQGQRIAAIEPELAKLTSVVRVIQFDANGGSGDMAPIGVFLGASATIPANAFTPPTDMQFASWNTKPDGTGSPYIVGDPTTPTKDIILYAQWTPVS